MPSLQGLSISVRETRNSHSNQRFSQYYKECAKRGKNNYITISKAYIRPCLPDSQYCPARQDFSR
jgi:hypothetical protein